MVKSMGGGMVCVVCVYRYGEKYGGREGVFVCVCIGMVKSTGAGWCVCVCVYRYGEKYGGREGVCVCV